MDTDRAEEILRQISYKEGWHLDRWYLTGGGVPILGFRWITERPDAYTGIVGTGIGGVSHVMLDESVDEESLVRRMFSSALAYEEHECREFFTYRGRRPFDPHKKLIEEDTSA